MRTIEAAEYGPHLVPHLEEPFVPERDLSKATLHAIQELADWALIKPHRWDIAVRLGTAVAVLSKGDLGSYHRDKGLRGRVDHVIRDQRSQPNFLRRDKEEYLRLVVGRKMVFPGAPVFPFDEELFTSVNRELAYMDNNAGEPLFWRVHLEEAKNVALLYPQQRPNLAIDKSFFDIVANALARARLTGDAENVARIGSAVRILYPQRVSVIDQFSPQEWANMKSIHHQLIDLAAQRTFDTHERYEEAKKMAEKDGKATPVPPPPRDSVYIRLAEHDANMAILAARKISVTPNEVKITPPK